MIRKWITHSISYYKLADSPVYVEPDEDMLLLRLDYAGFYFPRIYFLKFDMIRTILTTEMRCETRNKEYEIVTGGINTNRIKRVDCIDLTKDFLEKAMVEQINFHEFPTFMFHLLEGNTYEMKKYKECYQPLLPFFEFVGLDATYLDIFR